MTKVLFIGHYNKEGKFSDSNWNIIINWFVSSCNRLIVDTVDSIETIQDYFGNNVLVKELESPDPALYYKEYRLDITNIEFWDKFNNYFFQFDSGITHFYFYNNDELKAILELEDYDNFIFLDIQEKEEKDLIEMIESISQNIMECRKRKDDIEDLLNYENWKALGE